MRQPPTRSNYAPGQAMVWRPQEDAQAWLGARRHSPCVGKSAKGRAHSTTWRIQPRLDSSRSVVECGSPLPLFPCPHKSPLNQWRTGWRDWRGSARRPGRRNWDRERHLTTDCTDFSDKGSKTQNPGWPSSPIRVIRAIRGKSPRFSVAGGLTARNVPGRTIV